MPHMSRGGLGNVYNIQFVSALPNAGEHHEFKEVGADIRYECKTSTLRIEKGTIRVLTGSGFGVALDPDWVAKHQPVRLWNVQPARTCRLLTGQRTEAWGWAWEDLEHSD